MARRHTALVRWIIAAAERHAVERVVRFVPVVPGPSQRFDDAGEVGELDLCSAAEVPGHEGNVPGSIDVP